MSKPCLKLRRARLWWLNPFGEIRRLRAKDRHWKAQYEGLADRYFEASTELHKIKHQRSEASRKGGATKAANKARAMELQDEAQAIGLN